MGFKSITIDTNGYLFHDILDRVTPREVDFFSFSLDGATAATNDRIRGKGSYGACLDGIRRAVEAGFDTSMIYTVSRANLHELAAMVPLVSGLGVKRFFIQVIGLRGSSAQLEGESPPGDIAPVSREEWLERIPAVAGHFAERGISVAYPRVFLEPDELFECAGRVADNYFIFPNGRVYRCPLCEDYPIHSLMFRNDAIVAAPRLNEADLFTLDIAEGCVMNKLIQPGNLAYDKAGRPLYQIACCLLKEEVPVSEP
jgi:MoaA/NifB/PqqE/SkfB family radical SAM enzyme